MEAQRLGLRAHGSDLNPVAVLIGKALVEIPPKFAGRPPVNPKAQDQLRRGGCWNGKGAQGLADDVRYYGRWMLNEAAARIGHLYPEATLPDGSKAKVVAWLWARTVRSPDPAAKGAMVPLASTFMLSTKDGKKVWVETVIDTSEPSGWKFEIREGLLAKADEAKRKLGTKAGKGQAFVCALTGSPIDRPYIQKEGKADRLGHRLMAIVAEAGRGRVYLPSSMEHERIPTSVENDPIVEEARASFLSPPTPTRAMITGGVCSAYGLRTYGHIFTGRQVLALTTFADLVAAVREQVHAHAATTYDPNDNTALAAGGKGATAYADAIATYLAFAVDRAAEYGSTLSTWLTDDNAIRGTFGRQALPMTWDFCEGSCFGKSSADFSTILNTITAVISHQSAKLSANIDQIDAALNRYPVDVCVINTDPPYYSNIGYADLSDFFYVWMRRSLGSIWPTLFRRLTTPKDDELVATPYRHGGTAAAETFFMDGMSRALEAMRKASTPDVPLVIYYAFKQSETSVDGISSAGWSSFLQAVVEAGLSVDGTWPLRTESGGRLVGQGANALASSVVLVCRKREADAGVATRAEFVRGLKRKMPEAIDDIRKAGVGPVDMQQSVIGPGMGVFTRYAKVLENDDSPMSVKTALSLINRVWEEIENELDANFDPETQVALAWFANYGFDVKPSGELIDTRQRQEHSGPRSIRLRGVQELARQDRTDETRGLGRGLVARDRPHRDSVGMRAAHRARSQSARRRRRGGGAAGGADGREGG